MYTILVVDDEKDIVSALEIYLKAEGYRVLSAKEALAAAAREEVHLILMDIMMPELDGKEASRKIRSMADQREDAAEIPILAMTAQASTESIHQCELAGMNECIFKPVNAKELIGLLQDIVEKI